MCALHAFDAAAGPNPFRIRLLFIPMQYTTNLRKCQLFLNVFSATLQGSLALVQHALLLMDTPFHLETEHPLVGIFRIVASDLMILFWGG